MHVRALGFPRQFISPRGSYRPTGNLAKQVREDARNAMGKPVLRCARCRCEVYTLVENRLCAECWGEHPNAKATDVI